MFTRNLIRNSLAFVFTVTLTGVASARQPPALVEAQAQAERVSATCPQVQATSGYRDMLARVQTTSATGRAYASAPLPATRKMGDHLVIVCAGGELHQGSGYRDFPARIPAEPTEPLIAGTPRLVGGR